jgi:hypothetical protein
VLPKSANNDPYFCNLKGYKCMRNAQALVPKKINSRWVYNNLYYIICRVHDLYTSRAITERNWSYYYMQMIYKWVENTHCDAKRSHILDFHDENKHFDQQSNFFLALIQAILRTSVGSSSAFKVSLSTIIDKFSSLVSFIHE